MNDQAATLRTMASAAILNGNNSLNSVSLPERRCFAVTGGKGGVGKTNFAVSLALELGSLGNKVSLLDADFGLANADLLCGVSPKYHLGHLVEGSKSLADIAISLTTNVTLIPGGSGIEYLANLSLRSYPQVFSKLREMETGSDFMLIDTAAGISENVSNVLKSAPEVIVVVTPEPTSIVDAYATIKVILRHSPGKPIALVVNNVVGIGDAERVYQSINAAVNGFLEHRVNFLGMIPHDPQVQDAVREQVPVVQYAPNCPASRAIRLIAKHLNSQDRHEPAFPKVESFWELLGKN